MSTRTFASGGAFAHLLNRGKATQAATKKADNNEDEDEAAKKAETGDTTDPDDNEDKKKDKLDDIKDDKADPQDGTSKDTAKGKKAKTGEDEEEDGDTVEEDDEPTMKQAKRKAYLSGIRFGRRAEKAHGAAVFKCEGASDRPDIAAHLVFGTDMNTQASIETLKAVAGGVDQRSGRSRGPGMDQRMENVRQPDVGSDAPPKGKLSATDQFAADFEAAQKWRHGG